MTGSNKRRRGFTLVECLVVAAIVVLLIMLLLPAVRSPRPVWRAQCGNNLKNIALAIQNYAHEHGALPPARTFDAQGRPLHSWRTLILPYLDQEPLYRSIDLSKPWDDPANASARASRPAIYRCPESPRGGDATTYLAVVGDGFAFHPDRPRLPSEITDGHGSTAMVFESTDAEAVHWMAPRDADKALVLRQGPNSTTHHRFITHWAFVDGGLRAMNLTLPASTRRAILTIAAGDNMNDQDP